MATAFSATAIHTDVTPMNERILRLDLAPGAELNEAELDRHIEGALQMLFDDIESDPVPCLNFYCTGYWPIGSDVTDLDPAFPA